VEDMKVVHVGPAWFSATFPRCKNGTPNKIMQVPQLCQELDANVTDSLFQQYIIDIAKEAYFESIKK
jgi:hypothetical protein